MKKIKSGIVKEALEFALQNRDHPNVEELITSSSGRGMYGESALSIKLDRNSEFHVFIAALAMLELESANIGDEADFGLYDHDWASIALAEAYQTDSLGFGIIVYFPGWELEPDD